MKAIACKMALEEAYKAEDALYEGDMAKACACIYVCLKAMGPFVPDDGGMPQQMAYAMKAIMGIDKQYAFNQPQPSNAAGVPTSQPPANGEQPGSGVSEGNLAKAGRKISGARLDKLSSVLDTLNALVSELDPQRASTEKGGAPTMDEATQGKIKKLLSLVKSQQARINELSGARPTGNAVTPEGDGNSNPGPRVVWPDDLNDLDSDQ